MSNMYETKKFYFQEIDQLIEFTNCINHGKYSKYEIQIKTRGTSNQTGKATTLGEFLESTLVENNFPHTVGYFKGSAGEGSNFSPEYLALRKICSIEEFWVFLNASNL